jgi:hypothetical protein
VKRKHIDIPALQGITSAITGAVALFLVQSGEPVAAAVEGLLALAIFVAGAGKVSVFWR